MDKNVSYIEFVTLVFLGIAALSSLYICAFLGLPTSTQLGFIMVALTALALMSDKIETLRAALSGSGGATVDVSFRTNKVSDGPAVTVENIDNNRTLVSIDAIESDDLTDEVRSIRNALHEIMESGFNVENSIKGLLFLASHESFVKDSWLLLLNRASLLAMTGNLDLAETITREVLARFRYAKAVGWAYAILCWLEEFRTPSEDSALYPAWLEKKTFFAMKSVEADPHRHLNQMNAFEASVLNKQAKNSLHYLNNAVGIDEQFTRAKLLALASENEVFINKAKKLSFALNRKINKFLKEK